MAKTTWGRWHWSDIGQGRAHVIVDTDDYGAYRLACGRTRDRDPAETFTADEPSGRVCRDCSANVGLREATRFLVDDPTAQRTSLFDSFVKAAFWATCIGVAVWAGARAARG